MKKSVHPAYCPKNPCYVSTVRPKKSWYTPNKSYTPKPSPCLVWTLYPFFTVIRFLVGNRGTKPCFYAKKLRYCNELFSRKGIKTQKFSLKKLSFPIFFKSKTRSQAFLLSYTYCNLKLFTKFEKKNRGAVSLDI